MTPETPETEIEKSDMVRGLAPYWVLTQRLAYHSDVDSTDRLLSGLAFDREGKIQTIGDEDLPFVSLLNYEDQEGYGTGTAGTQGPFIEHKGILSLLVAAKRDYGMFRRDPISAVTEPEFEGVGALEWALRVRDAIEKTMTEPATMDWTMQGTVQRPLLFRCNLAEVSNLSWSFVIDVDIYIERIPRASRSEVSGYIWNQSNRNVLNT